MSVDEVCRYRRRREKDILRDIGFGPQFYYLRPFFVLMFGLFWSMPLSWIAVWMGARPPLLLDPFWGPVLVTWFSVGSGLMAMWAYDLAPASSSGNPREGVRLSRPPAPLRGSFQQRRAMHRLAELARADPGPCKL